MLLKSIAPKTSKISSASAVFSKIRHRLRMERATKGVKLPHLLEGVASSANLVFKAEEISATSDRGIIRWQLRWSEREADRVRGVNIMRVRDGKIVEGLGYVKA